MGHPVWFKVLVVMNILGWVAAAVVSWLFVSPGHEIADCWQHLREPVAAGIMSCVSVLLVAWKFSAPVSHVWRVAYRTGFEDGRAEAADNVIPFPRKASV